MDTSIKDTEIQDIETTEKSLIEDVELDLGLPQHNFGESNEKTEQEEETSSNPQLSPSLNPINNLGSLLPQNFPDMNAKSKAAFFHCAFKILQIFTFLFLGWFSGDKIVQFILVTILIILDFWTVKNVTGRLLCGLRWWTTVDTNGKEKWYFESVERELTDEDRKFIKMFWLSQIGITVWWGLIVTLEALSFSLFWACLSMIGLFLSGLNLYGYYKCNKEYKNKLKSTLTNTVINTLTQNSGGFAGALLSRFN